MVKVPPFRCAEYLHYRCSFRIYEKYVGLKLCRYSTVLYIQCIHSPQGIWVQSYLGLGLLGVEPNMHTSIVVARGPLPRSAEFTAEFRRLGKKSPGYRLACRHQNVAPAVTRLVTILQQAIRRILHLCLSHADSPCLKYRAWTRCPGAGIISLPKFHTLVRSAAWYKKRAQWARQLPQTRLVWTRLNDLQREAGRVLATA